MVAPELRLPIGNQLPVVLDVEHHACLLHLDHRQQQVIQQLRAFALLHAGLARPVFIEPPCHDGVIGRVIQLVLRQLRR